MERDDGGIRDFNDAIALYMDHQEQGDHQVGLRLAHVRTMLGTKLNDQGQNEEALGHFNKAVAALEPMVAGGRQDAGFHLALALMDRARAGIAVGSFESALDDCLRAITMYEGLVAEDRPHFEGSLGHAYLIRAEVRHAVGDFAGSTTVLARFHFRRQVVIVVGRFRLAIRDLAAEHSCLVQNDLIH